jgi:hypothetical protein
MYVQGVGYFLKKGRYENGDEEEIMKYPLKELSFLYVHV